MLPGQTLCQSSSRMLAGLERAISSAKPNLIVVQGDTTTTVCGALAGFYQKIPVAHVEAGLRTGDVQQPFPEEMNRVLTTRLANLHFPPTELARNNLLREGCPPTSICLTGNSGIDAVLRIRNRLAAGELSGCEDVLLDRAKKLILVTAHRRENFGPRFENVCAAVAQIAARRDVQVVFPVHPNPEVRSVAQALLGRLANVTLLDSLPYVPFVDLLSRAYLIVTDSGGIQEEAPAFGKPVLLLREKTERMEGVLAGTVKLVGTCTDRIVSQTTELLENPRTYRAMSRAHSPYGDGNASARISDGILAFFDRDYADCTTTTLQQMSRALTAWTQRFAPAKA
jgi:UDP-N-acetylglucosamine 2-epimerase (non-hydrolysing)